VTSLMLNFVSLAPGEALYLPAGNLHAYVSGMGLELMANSDNVLRGGLTPKHVDVDALIEVLEFKSTPIEKRLPVEGAAGQSRYQTSAAEFELWKLDLGERAKTVAASDGPEILIATDGKAVYQTSRYFVELLPGESAFLEARRKAYKLTGPGTVYRAVVPEPDSPDGAGSPEPARVGT
jgi:mannose-6-phosphate isomerase